MKVKTVRPNQQVQATPASALDEFAAAWPGALDLDR
jgi:hypothetical protein